MNVVLILLEMLRTKFDVRFYLVALLFIVFDLEVTFLFPWAVSLFYLGDIGFWGYVDILIYFDNRVCL